MFTLKSLYGPGQGEVEWQGLDGTGHHIGNGEGPYGRICSCNSYERGVGPPREQGKFQVSLQCSERLRKVSELCTVKNNQIQWRLGLHRRWVGRVVGAFKKRNLRREEREWRDGAVLLDGRRTGIAFPHIVSRTDRLKTRAGLSSESSIFQATPSVFFRRTAAQASKLRGKEFRFLLECLRLEDATLPEELIPPDLDWDLFLQATQRHSVVPLVHRVLGRYPGIPLAAWEGLDSLFRQNTCRSLFLTAELMRLLEGFSERGIPVLPYKGPTVAQQLYGDVALRSFSDLDLLVRVSDLQPATELLQSLGYAADHAVPPARRAAHLASASEQMFRGTDCATKVELQWRIAPAYFAVDFNWNLLWSNAVLVSMGERQVPALAPEVLLLVLSAHGAKHCWESLLWIADIAHLLRKFPQLDWRATFETARSLGIERLLLMALALAEEFLGVPLPAAAADLIASDDAISWLCHQVECHLALEEVSGIPTLADHWFSLRARERWRDRVRYVARLALTPNPQDWALLTLPPTMGSLYFCVRPLRLLGRTARWAWRRAVISAGSLSGSGRSAIQR